MSAVLEVEGVTKTFPVARDVFGRVRGRLHALSDVSIRAQRGQTLGMVGESGSGKSTLARVVLRLTDADSGRVRLDGEDITALSGEALRRIRGRMHMVFQDPRSSLDPSWRVSDLIAEPLRGRGGLSRSERVSRVEELLDQVGLLPEHANRYPHEFSGGQGQRIAIARSLALNPALVVCDEAVSALDVSTQAQILALLEDLQQRLGLAYLFIAHDLSVVHRLSNDIAVMYFGRVVETGRADEVYHRPRHPYTEALLSAIPRVAATARRRRIVVRGEPPSPIDPPAGCAFASRCGYAMDVCHHERPPMRRWGEVGVACHLHTEGPRLAGETVGGLPVPAHLLRLPPGSPSQATPDPR